MKGLQVLGTVGLFPAGLCVRHRPLCPGSLGLTVVLRLVWCGDGRGWGSLRRATHAPFPAHTAGPAARGVPAGPEDGAPGPGRWLGSSGPSGTPGRFHAQPLLFRPLRAVCRASSSGRPSPQPFRQGPGPVPARCSVSRLAPLTPTGRCPPSSGFWVPLHVAFTVVTYV